MKDEEASDSETALKPLESETEEILIRNISQENLE